MRTGVVGDLKQGHEYVVQYLVEVVDQIVGFEDVTSLNMRIESKLSYSFTRSMNTYNIRGIWMIHLLFGEYILFLTAHSANESHSLYLRP